MKRVCTHSHSKKLDLLLLDFDLTFGGVCSNHLSGHPFVHGRSLSDSNEARRTCIQLALHQHNLCLLSRVGGSMPRQLFVTTRVKIWFDAKSKLQVRALTLAFFGNSSPHIYIVSLFPFQGLVHNFYITTQHQYLDFAFALDTMVSPQCLICIKKNTYLSLALLFNL